MKVIFAIRGISNAGKSSTVRRVKALLEEQFPQAEWDSWKDRRGRGDICGVLTIDGVKIGIEGQGDVAEHLRCSIEKFVEVGCEIFVCTDRTERRKAPDPVEAMKSDGWDVRWKPKERSVPSQRQANDEAVAREIVGEIAEALNVAGV